MKNGDVNKWLNFNMKFYTINEFFSFFSSLLLVIYNVQTQYFIYFPFIFNNIFKYDEKNTLLEKHPLFTTKFIKLKQSERVLFDIIYYCNE